LSAGIRHLRDERQRQGVSFPITIKPTVNAHNFRHLPALVEWAQAIGADAVSPQPMNRWTQETYDELWIEAAELPEFEAIVERLIAMKRAGAPLLTPPHVLALMPDHFREKQAPADVMPCRVGLRNYFIRTNGDVEVCGLGFPTIGNVKTQAARDIWYSEQARATRRDTVACEKLCLITCLSQKTLGYKVRMGVELLRSVRTGERMPMEVE